MLTRPVARTTRILVEKISTNECVVYDLDTKYAHLLNPALRFIWEQCDGTATVEQIAGRMQSAFGEGSPEVVASGLAQLGEANLLEESAEPAALAAAAGAGVSRRSMVLGGSAVVPLLTSVLAPTAAAAARSHPQKKAKKPPVPPGKLKKTT